MNEKIDLTKILKDCPTGWKLYSTIYGDVEFIEVLRDPPILWHERDDEWHYERIKNNRYPIKLMSCSGEYSVSCEGKYRYNVGECTLFPSKDQRDWNKFSAPWYKNSKFNDGDIVAVGKNSELQVFILQIVKSDKNGYCYIGYDFKLNKIFLAGRYEFDRFATEEEKQKLFNAIKENGYKWDAKTKTLYKETKTKTLYKETKTKTLYKVEPKFNVGDKIVNIPMKSMGGPCTQATISEVTNGKYIFTDGSYTHIINQDNWELVIDKKAKFDPNTLKPFDRVLVRDYNDDKWVCSIFSHIEPEDSFHYECILELNCRYCIPYNDDTKHLVGTTKEAPEFYRYWEE